MQKIKYDKIRKLDKIVFLALGLILMALVIQMAILNWINNKNTAKMSEVLLDRVVNVIEKNEDNEKIMITSPITQAAANPFRSSPFPSFAPTLMLAEKKVNPSITKNMLRKPFPGTR